MENQLEEIYKEAAQTTETEHYSMLAQLAFDLLDLQSGQTYYTVAGLGMPYQTQKQATKAARQEAQENGGGFAQVRKHVVDGGYLGLEDSDKLVGYVHTDNSCIKDAEEIKHLAL